VKIRSITDGTSNTVLIVPAAESVPWTKPEELTYDPNGRLPNSTICAAAATSRSATARSVSSAPQSPRTHCERSSPRDGGEVVPID